MLWSDRQLEIEERARALRFQVHDQRRVYWPDREPRGLEIADPAIAADVLGIHFEYVEGLGFSLPSASSQIAGLLDRRKGTILVARRFGPEVARFTAAHELGHWMLHEADVLLHRDLPIQGLEHRARDPLEREADHFAACFLMPRGYVRDQFKERFRCEGQFVIDEKSAYFLRPHDVSGLLYPEKNSLLRETVLASAKSYDGRHFDSLATLFKVSIETMAIRIRELRLVRS